MRPITKEFQKWRLWAQSIQKDVENALVHPRQVFREFDEAIKGNEAHIEKHGGDDFCYLVRDCYVSHVAMAIRRQVKVSNDSVSLMRLLAEIHECSPQFTYEFYLANFPIDPKHVTNFPIDPDHVQQVTFAKFSEDRKTVTPAIVQKDIDDLKAITSRVEDLADKAIAHLDRSGFQNSVTFGDLDASVGAIDSLVCKYLKLLTGSGFTTLEEPKNASDRTQIFTVPFDNRGEGNV